MKVINVAAVLLFAAGVYAQSSSSKPSGSGSIKPSGGANSTNTPGGGGDQEPDEPDAAFLSTISGGHYIAGAVAGIAAVLL